MLSTTHIQLNVVFRSWKWKNVGLIFYYLWFLLQPLSIPWIFTSWLCAQLKAARAVILNILSLFSNHSYAWKGGPKLISCSSQVMLTKHALLSCVDSTAFSKSTCCVNVEKTCLLFTEVVSISADFGLAKKRGSEYLKSAAGTIIYSWWVQTYKLARWARPVDLLFSARLWTLDVWLCTKKLRRNSRTFVNGTAVLPFFTHRQVVVMGLE